jgi:hypothetical protein
MAQSHLIPIPRGTGATQCRKCKATIYFAPHPSSGRAHPVSVAPAIAAACVEPTALLDGAGISHFADCPNADDFRSTKRGSPPL